MSINVEWVKQLFPELSGIRVLAEGGQKWVFTCIHPKYKNIVLKIIKPGNENRLDREIEAVQRIPNNVPQIFEVKLVPTQIGGLVVILEEYIDGISLSDLLGNRKLSRNQLLQLTYDLVFVAMNAEENKIVHRDIKPDNIKIDRNGKAWLLDFGIARILDLESKTKTDAVLGPHTPGYGAPEQFRNLKKNIDGRADLFAIGITLYEAASGKNPFIVGARDRLEVLRRVETQPLPVLKLSWDVENKYSGFISSLTQKYPHQRPDNCKEAFEWFNEIRKSMGD
ncbi:MAG: serine/threonine protein kinase [Chloroflexi bacterium]|nr:serine/threonine protein kinase [Chloroflexota bacterium]MBI5705087.1 serine/threonine protein kinase [Chloroflexota bacterium]